MLVKFGSGVNVAVGGGMKGCNVLITKNGCMVAFVLSREREPEVKVDI